jgi:phage gp36-like protein
MFLSVPELYTHLYDEIVDNISRCDESIPLHCISAAISEAKGYLAARFDVPAIFDAEGEERNELLLIFVKDIAVWHFVNLGNTCTDLDLREKRYDRAIAWLKGVQKGDISPDLPLKDESHDGFIPTIAWGSNPKRDQHF